MKTAKEENFVFTISGSSNQPTVNGKLKQYWNVNGSIICKSGLKRKKTETLKIKK